MSSTPRNLSRSELFLLSISKIIVNTGIRMVYPFLPVISRGLGIPFETAALAVTGNFLIGFTLPVLGSVADLHSRKSSMLFGLGVFILGISVIVIWPSFPGLLLSLMISATGNYILDSAIQAYVGDRVDFDRRGRAIAIVESGWSLASLIGIPLVGWVISKWGWKAPFPILALLAGFALITLIATISNHPPQSPNQSTITGNFRAVFSSRMAVTGIAVGFLMSAGHMNFNIIFGAWMEGEFKLEILALGSITGILGFAYLSGQGLVAAISDRIGLRTALSGGIAGSILAALILPLVSKQLVGALVIVFLFYLLFEFSYISNLALMTEMIPGSRATMLSIVMAGSYLGMGLASWLGPALFNYGILANSLFAAGLNITALVLILRFMRE